MFSALRISSNLSFAPGTVMMSTGLFIMVNINTPVLPYLMSDGSVQNSSSSSSDRLASSSTWSLVVATHRWTE